MATTKITLTNTAWTLIGTGAHDLQRENSAETIYLHFGAEPLIDSVDYQRIVDNDVYQYRGTEAVYARALGGQAFLNATPVISESDNYLQTIAAASLPDKETPVMLYRVKTGMSFTGASAGDPVLGILTINTVTNTLVSNAPIWYNGNTKLPLVDADVDTAKLEVIAANSLTAAELATLVLKIGDGTNAVAVETSGTDATSNTQNNLTATVRLKVFNGTTWDRVRSAITTVSSTLTGMINTLPWSIYKATPTTRTDGQGGTLLSDAQGNLLVNTAVKVTKTDKSGTITTGGTQQTLMAANSARRGYQIQNNSTGDLWFNELGVSAIIGQPSLKLAPGDYYESPHNAVGTLAISIIGATTGQSFTAREW